MHKSVIDLYRSFSERGYFDQYLGKNCVDGRETAAAGLNIAEYVRHVTGNDHLWPIDEYCERYTEDDVRVLMAFLRDHVSKPLQQGAWLHVYGNCGYHYEQFDRAAGRAEFDREELLFKRSVHD